MSGLLAISRAAGLHRPEVLHVRIVMTVMVRDEADTIAAMLEHHRSQGVDHVIVTDNASVDGTTEILQRYADEGFVTLWHDPEHRKQQFAVVTRMARHAATEEHADWVINADADEFWVATTPGRTVREVVEGLPSDQNVVEIPVVNLTGAPARRGSGFERLCYRDLRSDDELHAAGIPFHPTSDALHRGNPDVEIAQGNHFVDAPGWGPASQTDQLEVLHLPWRSWAQYEGKVRKAGQAYESNPDLFPSPRHHGKQDYRRWKAGRLEAIYISKHPLGSEVERMLASGALVRDDRLASLASAGLPGVQADDPYTDAERDALARHGRQLSALEQENEERLQALRDEQLRERSLWVAWNAFANGEIERLTGELELLRSRRIVRLANRLHGVVDAVRPERAKEGPAPGADAGLAGSSPSRT